MAAATPTTCFLSTLPLPTPRHHRRSSRQTLRLRCSHHHDLLLRFSPAVSAIPSPQSLFREDEEEEPDYDDEDPAPQWSAEPDYTTAAEARRAAAPAPDLEVPELEELPEQWRRAKVAWLCKELPCYRHSTFTRVLNAQRKWITQDDATYVAVHCLRIRENDAAFRVYNWMSGQHWYRFNFALATRLADYLGKEGKISKCRQLFDEMIKQGRVPSESTFHILTVAYLGATVDGSLVEAIDIYNRMIQVGGYRPPLTLHNALFRALVNKTGGTAKHYLKQAEFVYHNILTSNLDVHRDIYTGLIWLHSYQDKVDRERITALRQEMKEARFKETIDILVSVLRAHSKEGDVDAAERAWRELLQSGTAPPVQAYVCRIDLYGKVGEPMKALAVFEEMKEKGVPPNISAYHKIINVLTSERQIDASERLMDEFIGSSMKHLMPAFLDVMTMYSALEMHDQLASTFSKCLARCRPNRFLYTIYLESLVRTGDVTRAEEIFHEMQHNPLIGTSIRSCNIILGALLDAKEQEKAGKIYDMMRQKKYAVDPSSLEKIQNGPIVTPKVVVAAKADTMKLDQEQREILTGMLLGGAEIKSDMGGRNHVVDFKFREDSDVHSALKMHVHERFYEWLTPSCRSDHAKVPCQFSTVPHSHFEFFAGQFFFRGRPAVPKLIHRWLSLRVMAYWFMFGGARLASGDVVLRVNVAGGEGVERIARALQARNLACKLKVKGGVSWIGLQGRDAESFLNLIQPYLLVDADSSDKWSDIQNKDEELIDELGSPSGVADDDNFDALSRLADANNNDQRFD